MMKIPLIILCGNEENEALGKADEIVKPGAMPLGFFGFFQDYSDSMKSSIAFQLRLQATAQLLVSKSPTAALDAPWTACTNRARCSCSEAARSSCIGGIHIWQQPRFSRTLKSCTPLAAEPFADRCITLELLHRPALEHAESVKHHQQKQYSVDTSFKLV